MISSVAARLARLEHHLSHDDHQRIYAASGGLHIQELTRRLVDSLNPDLAIDARPELVEGRTTALQPLHNPDLRNLLIELKKKSEQVIDHVSQDIVIESGFSSDALNRTRQIVQSFEQFIQDHKDEITALQILYSIPARRSTKKAEKRLTFEQLKELAEAIQRPPHLWNESQLWQAYAALDKSKVKGATARRILTDLVSLVRYAIHQDNELVPFPERVNANFNAWLAQISRPRESGDPGIRFTPEQFRWLEMIRDHIAANLKIDRDDFDYAPFAQKGGIGKVYQLFGDRLDTIIEELNEVLAA